jgi:hypothetical protein
MVSTAEGGTITIGLRLTQLWNPFDNRCGTAFPGNWPPHQKSLGSNVPVSDFAPLAGGPESGVLNSRSPLLAKGGGQSTLVRPLAGTRRLLAAFGLNFEAVTWPNVAGNDLRFLALPDQPPA